VMWGAVELNNHLLAWRDDGPFNERLLTLAAAIAVGMATFFIASHLFKCREMARILETVRGRFR